MTYSPFTATGDGTTTAYTIAFDYIDTTDVKARVNDVVTTAFTVSGSTVTFNTAPPNGQSIKIFRDTDNATIQADFQSGSALRAVDLNSNFTQLLYVTQESTDISDTAESDSAAALTAASAAQTTANTASTDASNAVTTANNAAATVNTNTSNIATNTSNISTNTSNIATNTADIATNTTNIATKMPIAGGTFTGDVNFDDNVIIKGDSTNGSGKITLNCENNSHAVKIKGPPHSAGATYTLILPNDTGNNGNALLTDGSGNLSWGSPSADVSNKADVDSPTFTGTPAAPTAAQGTNTTQLATTAFVNSEIAADTASLAPAASPAFTGTPTCPTAGVNTDTTQVANTAFVQDVAALKADKNNALLTGTPTLQTSPALNDDSLKIATTAYVKDQISNDALSSNSPALTGVPTAPTAATTTNTTQIATTAFVQQELTAETSGLAPIASPTFTGTPAAPTAAAGTSTTQLATTAYVQNEVGHSIQAFDNDTTKNDVANTFTALQTFNAGLTVDGPYTQTVENGNSNVDLSTGNYFYKTVTANQDFSASGWVTNVPASGTVCSFTFEITVNSGYSITGWPSSVKWAGGQTPVFNAGHTHLAFFVTRDGGTTWYGSAIINF